MTGAAAELAGVLDELFERTLATRQAADVLEDARRRREHARSGRRGVGAAAIANVRIYARPHVRARGESAGERVNLRDHFARRTEP